MLIYVGFGPRRYGDSQIACFARRAWEFQAVLRGSIAPVLPDGPDISGRKKLWLFPPGHIHGWTAGQGTEAEIAVFHYLSIPEPLLAIVREKSNPLEILLGDEDCRRIRKLVRKASEYWKNPTPITILCHEQALTELSLLICEATQRDKLPSHTEAPAWKTVQHAMQVFAENMGDNFDQEKVARIAGTSPSHLRRLFHKVLQSSPKRVFDQMRFQRAIQLMADPAAKLENVGEACGFGSASAFSRAFKLRFGCSPQAWRGYGI
jgi:AraC family transcriptional regulator